MKPFISSILVFLTISAFNGQASHSIKVRDNLKKFIIDWGYIENYHPLIVSNEVNADSLFCIFTNAILEDKTDYKSLTIIDSLNSIATLPLEIESPLYAFLASGAAYVDVCPPQIKAIELKMNKRVTYDSSTFQFAFYTTIHTTLPLPSLPQRILAISKIWNNYRFYYPYKEILPNNRLYVQLLEKYLNKIQNCRNFSEYHLTILQFTAEFRDSHSKANSFTIRNQFGRKTIPAKVRFINGYVVITDYYERNLFDRSKLKIGDIVLKVNNESVKSIFRKNKRYVPYSNQSALNRDLCGLAVKTNYDSLRLLIKRDNNHINVSVPTYTIGDLFEIERKYKEDNSLISINDSTLYIKCDHVDTISFRTILINNRKLKWFIFDVRSSTRWIKSTVDEFFFQLPTQFATYYYPLTLSPGSFSELIGLNAGPSPANFRIVDPKVIILVNEYTQSQGEFQTMALQAIPNSITIGSRTAGTDGNTSVFTVPGNINIHLTLLGIEYPCARKTQIAGVRIDRLSSSKIKLAKIGVDQDLNLALEIIKKGGL